MEEIFKVEVDFNKINYTTTINMDTRSNFINVTTITDFDIPFCFLSNKCDKINEINVINIKYENSKYLEKNFLLNASLFLTYNT